MEYPEIKPQWAPESVEHIDNMIRKDFIVFEWGTGLSTPWLAERVGHVFTMDDDANWAGVAGRLCRQQRLLDKVDFFIYPAMDSRYLQTIFFCSEFEGGIDIAIVDGQFRPDCVSQAAIFVKPGGLIILDDSERADYKSAFEVGGLSIFAQYPAAPQGKEQRTTIFRKHA